MKLKIILRTHTEKRLQEGGIFSNFLVIKNEKCLPFTIIIVDVFVDVLNYRETEFTLS